LQLLLALQEPLVLMLKLFLVNLTGIQAVGSLGEFVGQLR